MATKEEKLKQQQELVERARPLFSSIGLDANVVEGALKNPKFTQSLLDVIDEAGVAASGCPKAQGNFLYTIASKHPANALVHRPALLEYVMSEQIKRIMPTLEESAGVGVVVTPQQVAAAVTQAVEEKKDQLIEERLVSLCQ
eukprot:gene12928-13056_t